MSLTHPETLNPPTAFLARRSELTDRFDPEIVLFRRKVHRFNCPVHKLREFLIEPAQYGAGERSLERVSPDQPRYVRITDIDENGILTDELGATAADIESRYLLEEDDLLVARSGNTVGKSYLHKSIRAPYPCFFAGYLIRLKFKRARFLPDYAFALTQLPYYKEWVRAVQRAAGQPNINAQEYSNLDVPVPALSVQERVVVLLEKAYEQKGQREAEARELLRSVDDVLFSELGIRRDVEAANQIQDRMFRSRQRELSGRRWDPNHSRYMVKFLKKLAECRFEVHKLKDFLAVVQYGISERATEEAVGVPMLRMLNLQDGAWDVSDLKYIELDDRDKQLYLLKHGDILFNRTNSKELVGKCNVFNLQGEYVFASYLMRVRLKDEGGLRPEYVVAYLGSYLGQMQTDAISRQIAGMSNINAEEIRDLFIPVPPHSVQGRVCDRVAEIRRKANELRLQASLELKTAKNAIEALVRGQGAA